MIKTITIGHTQIHGISLSNLLDAMAERIQHRTGPADYICFCEAHLCVRANRQPEIRQVLNDAFRVLPDGVSITLGARLLGYGHVERLPGPSVMLACCQYGVARGWRHFFYGSGPGVADKLAENLIRQIPGLQVAGTYSPPFRELTASEQIQIHQRINDLDVDVLWVGLGAPKQELWMAQHRHHLRVPIMLGIGAAFDFHSGHRKWAPPWIRKMGLEWLFRMVTGGRRVFIRNAIHESIYTWLILNQVFRKRILRLGNYR